MRQILFLALTICMALFATAQTPPTQNKLDILAPNLAPGNSNPKTPEVRLRGFTSLGDNNPLIILDGCQYDGDLNQLDPNTIQSITVLKDAAAISLYGKAAVHGVIIISTKKKKVVTAPEYVLLKNADFISASLSVI